MKDPVTRVIGEIQSATGVKLDWNEKGLFVNGLFVDLVGSDTRGVMVGV
ncbi:hypothetical protein [Cellulosimicrobium sp. SJTW-1]